MLRVDAIREALRRVVDPCSIAAGAHISLVDMGMVEEIDEVDGAVRITLMLTSPICWQAGNIIAKVEEVVGALPGVQSVACVLDPIAQWMPEHMHPDARARLRLLRPMEVLT
jgi:metal-sulfur cluster biosynthetic enzyme